MMVAVYPSLIARDLHTGLEQLCITLTL